MKKKLIAAVTSLAMVATMVPATAFAAVDQASAIPKAVAEAKVAASADYNDVAEKLVADYAEPKDPTYDQFATYDTLKRQIDKLSIAEQDILTNGMSSDYYNATEYPNAEDESKAYENFKSGYDKLKKIDDEIVRAQTLIKQINTKIEVNDKTLAAANEAFNDVVSENAALSSKYNEQAEDLEQESKKYATLYVGASLVKNLTDAKNIQAVVNAINGMPPVDNKNYSEYEKDSKIIGITKAYNNLSVASQERLINRDDYLANLNGAVDARAAEDIIGDLELAVKRTYASSPYAQADITALQTLLDQAIAAVKKLPSTIDTDDLEWTGTNTALGTKDGKYEDGTATTKIKEMKEYVENDAAVKPVVSAIEKLSTSMKWSETNKETMFAATYAYESLNKEQKDIIEKDYASANKLLTDAKNNWRTQEAANKTEAKAWLEAKMKALTPATLTIADKDTVRETEAAYDEYNGGYLSGILTLTNIDATLVDNLNLAIKKMDTLEATQLEADKKAAKAFLDLMGDKEVENSLWWKVDNNKLQAADEPLVKEARAAYDKLTDSQKALTSETAGKAYDVVNAYKALQEAEKYFAAGDAETIANELMVAIRALPSNPTLADKDTVYALNDKYNASVKANTNIADLVKNKTDLFKAVGTVMDLEITALPILKGDGTDTQEAIDAAAVAIKPVKERFDTIGTEQQKQVSKAATLSQAETQLSKAQVVGAKAALEEALKVDPTKELTAEEAAAIATAKAAIDALTADQKKELNADNVKKLNEELIPALEKYQAETAKLENATIAPIADQAYTGKAIEPAVTVTDKTGAVVDANEYTVIYSNNVNVGEAKVVVAAKSGSVYTGTATATFQIIRTTTSIASATVGDIADKTYTGSAIKPAVSVKLGNDTLKAGTDYTVAYKNNTKLGKATVTITGTGNYTGTITKSFIIKPAKESITSVKGGKGKITVAYKTQNKAKYRIITKKSGTKAKGTNTLATSKTVKNLKKGSYQVKVRAYKVIDGKTYYGAYSAVKTVKVK